MDLVSQSRSGGPDTDWDKIAIGQTHTVATKTDGTLYSVGYNFEGTLKQDPIVTGFADNIALFYKWTNTYATPTASLINGTFVDFDNLPSWNTRLLSTTGPNGTLVDVPELAADTTYYTPYLMTQLVVYKGDWDDYGNLGSELKLRMTMKEFKSGLPGYDPDLVKWTW